MAACGVLVGGAVTTRFRLRLHQMALLVGVCNALFAAAIAAAMLVSCDQRDALQSLGYVQRQLL